MVKPTSPSGSGPAGAHFESKVGGYYLLALLMDAEPRALPGARIMRVQFQGAGDGFPLDDVVVHAESGAGGPALADIQVKKAITFAPTDVVFAKVVYQIAEAVRAGKLDAAEYTMAVATAENSRKIDGPYQQVLLWARHSESTAAFFRKLNRVGVSSEPMRVFVGTLRTHLQAAGVSSDDETVWKILRKFQILIFDFVSTSGQSEALVRDRCAQALDPAERGKAGALWTVLCEIAEDYAVNGGEIEIETLRQTLAATHGLKLAGLRQNYAARAALRDASRMALQDIRDQVGNAKLARWARLDLINISLDAGRYVEIRGDAGVGKSGLLRSLAEQVGIEGNAIVLSPVRTTPRGWIAMRDALRFDGSARELLSDVAVSGGAILFIDGADYFGETERATANDLIREVAAIPGFKVVITVRRSFGVDEPSWIDADAIEMLGRAPTVTVDELGDDEVEELRDAAPALAPLLADGHPARDVVRNLFRLDRLFQLGQGAGQLRTEADLAQLWWQSGDGKQDGRTRDRIRILRDLAEKSLPGYVGPLDTSQYNAGALDDLVRSETLRDLRGERMVFRHDVFRDWAVANILHEDFSKTAVLPLSRPAPPSLSRGVELMARMAIERDHSANAWKTLQARLGQAGVHGSWQRAVIVALVRSELSPAILARAEGALFANDGKLLRDLIRTLMALEVKPAGEVMASLGIALSEEFKNIPIPVGPAWRRLASWLVAVADRLPANAVQDVAELFSNYSASMQLVDPLVPKLVSWLHTWLMELEGFQRDGTEGDLHHRPLGGRLDYDRERPLLDYVRSSFLALSAIKPDLAELYVTALLRSERRSRGRAETVIMSPGNLAKAAPNALATLTAATLIEPYKPRRSGGVIGYERSQAFTYADSQFLSPSPARGPFLELLLHSPKEGLGLVRQLVGHACAYYNDQKPASDNDKVTIELETGPRSFPFMRSYYWSRTGNDYCVTSALMALEAWAHLRIDGDETVEHVIADILGDEELPAAYLLVIVDVLLSHFPKSFKAAVPFLGCPELLAWDRERHTHDQVGAFGDFFGEREPRAAANLESLKKRSSRKFFFEQLLPLYMNASSENGVDIEGLRGRLQRAQARLGNYGARASYGDPAFMVHGALNRLDPINYKPHSYKDADGNDQVGLLYDAPGAEAEHLAALQSDRSIDVENAGLRAALQVAVDDPARSSIDLMGRAITWAKATDQSGEELPDFDQSLLITAMLLMRDGDAQQRSEHRAWAEIHFAAAAKLTEDPVHRMRNGLLFNPIGLATAGMTHGTLHGRRLVDAQPLLEIAVRGDPAAAHGFAASLEALAAIDPRLPKAILRCAFVGNIRPRLKGYDAKGKEDEVLLRQFAKRQKAALAAEWKWLNGSGPEPAWVDFPEALVRVKDRVFIGGTQPRHTRRLRATLDFEADHQAAGLWLSKFTGVAPAAPEWMRSVAHHYRDWTSKLNGAGLDVSAELSRSPDEWNGAYYRLVARSLAGLNAQEIDSLCLAPVICLPDEPFLGVVADFLYSLDGAYFNGQDVGAQDAVQIRAKLVDRLKKTSEWRRYTKSPGHSVTFRLDQAISAVFMTQRGLRTPPKCYVTEIRMPKVVPFIPLLTGLAIEAPGLFTAQATISTIGVSADYPFIAYGVTVIQACMAVHPNDTALWADYGVGKSFCAWVASILTRAGAEPFEKEGLRGGIEQILSDLIRLGVTEATSLEVMLLDQASA